MTTDVRHDNADSSVAVILNEDRRWAQSGDTRATGWAFVNGTYLRAPELAARFDDVDPRQLGRLLSTCNGSFAAVRRAATETFVIVDTIRSIPLFIAADGQRRLVTDDPEIAIDHVPVTEPSWERVAEFYATRYVTGPDTLLVDVGQVEAGTFVTVPDEPSRSLSTDVWFRFHPAPLTASDNSAATGAVVLRNAVQRTVEAADGAQILVPLSGGLDSALLVHLLADLVDDPEQLLTYTFGDPDGEEVAVSRRRADALGLRWHVVGYTHETWRSWRQRPTWSGLLRTTSSLSAVPNVLDLPALEQMRDDGLVDDGALVVPGHALDFVAGSWVPGRLARLRAGTRNDVVEALLARHYRCRSMPALARLVDRPVDEVGDLLRSRVEQSVRAPAGTLSGPQLVAAADEWAWSQRQTKLIGNAVRVYDVHGLRWALPWWDLEVVRFWEKVPLEHRLGVKLRSEIGELLGVRSQASPLGRLRSFAELRARAWGLDEPLLQVRRVVRRRRTDAVYDGYPLSLFGLVDEQHFNRWFTGHETPWTFLGEQVVSAIEHG